MFLIEPKVMLVEDDAGIRSLVVRGLTEEGFEVTAEETAAGLLRRLVQTEAHVIIVDIGLPDADGRDLVQAIRARGIGAPVIFLTARDSVPDLLSGFEAGGDDYLVKPFVLAELVARVRALVKRGGADLAVESGSLRLDPAAHVARCGDTTMYLTPTEFKILARLAGAPGHAVRRRELVRAAWPHGAIVHDNTLDVYISRLRRKLASLDDAPEIVTAVGVGYVLQ
jgi:two-component system response regulator MprA